MSKNITRGSPTIHVVQPCQVILFPLKNRVGKIRDVAAKLLEKSSARHAEYYRTQVAEGLFKQFEKIGLPDEEQDEQVGAFFEAVDIEASRLIYWSRNPGGKSA